VTNLAVVRLEMKGYNPVSTYKDFLEAIIGRPVIIRAADNWTFPEDHYQMNYIHPRQQKHILKLVVQK
jgi:hypothetical protein